jgi:proline iminopeptidase
VYDKQAVGMDTPIRPPVGSPLTRCAQAPPSMLEPSSERFDEQGIYLVTNSWGSTLGVLMAQRSPELFRAYVGTGQMVSQRATDQILYQDVLAYLQRTGDRRTERKLRAWGPPPWEDPDTDALAHTTMLLYYEDLQPYPQSAELPSNGMVSRFFPSEYGVLDSWNALRGLGDMFSVIYPQLQSLDFRQAVTRLEVPVYLLQGRHELHSRMGLALEWFEALQAPSKQLIWFDRSGHNPQFEERGRVDDLMVGKILTETY